MTRCDDYCCNHGCNQGRNCPARVAKIGRKEHGREPLRGASWRRHLKDLARAFLLVLAVMLVSGLTVALIPKRAGVNCAHLVGGWHPDVPQHIRAKCLEAV